VTTAAEVKKATLKDMALAEAGKAED